MFSKTKRTHEGLTILASFEPICERQYLRSILRDAYVNLFLSKLSINKTKIICFFAIYLIKILKMIYWIFEQHLKHIKMIHHYLEMHHLYQVKFYLIIFYLKQKIFFFFFSRCYCLVTYIIN
jgi:hypothetical protein